MGTCAVPVWAVDGLTTLAGLQLSVDFLGPYGSIQFRTLHHCVCLLMNSGGLWVILFPFLPPALCSFLVTLTESVFSVYKLF